MFIKTLIIALAFLLSNCSGNKLVTNPVTGKKGSPGLFSKDSTKGINLTDILAGKQNPDGNITINAYLWRASLNILSIAPLLSTDALGGVIISDWYVNEELKNQRIKISVFVLGPELRSDGIKVIVHIQNFKDNSWSDTIIDTNLADKIEENILNEARNIRINSINKK